MGYCPQFDALFDLLTGREHLNLYARIKGVREEEIDRVVNKMIRELDLVEYADRSAGSYSGGNKRKLSVAMAMMGDPKIIFLDEPSTGMDPVARRFMWDVISGIVDRKECSIILTSHSMEETEALCHRIGIMVGGRLRCLGSAHHLRSRFGQGFQIEFGLSVPSEEELDDISGRLSSSTNELENASSIYATTEQVTPLLAAYGRQEWAEQISPEGAAVDIYQALLTTGRIEISELGAWVMLQERYEQLVDFLDQYFEGYTIRERQHSKIRIEVPRVNLEDDSPRRLSDMFSILEEFKESLFIEEYSISQTSLEQIFNFFASQQEEEKGHIAGMHANE
jgi:ABC-type multidrug transport system ATPase subunit